MKVFLPAALATLKTVLAHLDLVTLDDWLVSPLTDVNRRDLFEILEDRYDRRSTIVCAQLPQELWYDAIGDPMLADAILDRLVHNAHRPMSAEALARRRIDLKGESQRKARGLQREEAVFSPS